MAGNTSASKDPVCLAPRTTPRPIILSTPVSCVGSGSGNPSSAAVYSFLSAVNPSSSGVNSFCLEGRPSSSAVYSRAIISLYFYVVAIR